MTLVPVNVTLQAQVNSLPAAINPSGPTIVLLGASNIWLEWTTTASLSANTNHGMFTRFQQKAGYPFTVLNNAAINAGTSDMMLAALPTSVLAYNPDYVFMYVGDNDFPIGGDTVAKSISNLTGIITQCIANGSQIILCTTMCRSDTASSPANILHNCAVNQWIRDYAAKNRGIILIDLAAATLNLSTYADSLTLTPNTNLFYDGFAHLSAYGAAFIGEGILYNALAPLFPKIPHQILCNQDSGSGDTTIANNNPMLLAGAGGIVGTGVTGYVAQGWTAQRFTGTSLTATSSIVARSTQINDLYPGFLQHLSITNSTNALDLLGIFQTITPAVTTQTYVLQCEVSAVASSGTISGLVLNGTFNGASFAVEANSASTGGALPPGPMGSPSFYGILQTQPFTIPAGTTSVLIQVGCGVSVGGSADFYIGNVQMRAVQV